MPTGYTAPLYEGEEISFEEFMLRCSRGWGVAIVLRDHPPDVLPTEENVVEGDWRARLLVEAEARYDRVRDLTPDEVAAEHQAELEERARANAENVANCEAIRERYEAMLARVSSWEPPTEDHVGFKAFVIEQLTESLAADATSYARPLETLTDAEWQAARLERLGAEIKRQREDVWKQAERDVERQRWVRELRESLEGAKV